MRIMLGPVLPKEYQEVEYIASSNGAQYIDTGYIPSYTRGFEITFETAITTRGKRYCLLSNYNQGNAQLSLEINASNAARLWLNNGNLDTTIGNLAANTKTNIYYKYENGAYSMICGETGKGAAYSTPTSAPNYSMYLFLDRMKRTSTFNTPLRIYKCEIKEQGVFIKKFVPCYRRSDNAIGMYETVEGKFYPNDGTGNFIKGNDILNNFIACKVALARLPKAYQEVAYLEGTGTQYIKTTLVPSTSLGYSIEFQASNLTYSSGVDNVFFGSRGSSKRFWVDYDMSGSNRNLLFGYGNYYRVILNLDGVTDIFKVSSNVEGNQTGHFTAIRGNQTPVTYDASSDSISGNTYPVYLFAANDAGTAKFFSKIRIYNCKIYQNGVLTAEFVPCYRKADNVAGMYDAYNGAFYPNNGTGTFNIGPEVKTSFQGIPSLPEYSLVPRTYQRISYIQCSGTQYINTDYYWTSDNTETQATIDFLSRSANGQTLYGNEEHLTSSSRYFASLLHGGSSGGFAAYVGGSAALLSTTLPSGKGTLDLKTTASKQFTVSWNNTVLNSKAYSGTVNTRSAAMTVTNNTGKIYIFSNHNSGTNGQNATGIQLVQSMKLYEFIMWDNGEKVRHFLPCIRTIDNVAGLYDIVGQKFYTNDGTGSFITGPVL